MAGIPPALESDLEDVAWALQTADALWKRGERQDAIVWLRRAAQTAGDAEDDDRALSLARNAAELADWLSRNSSMPGPLPSPRPVPRISPPLGAIEEVDDLLVESDIEALPAEDVASVHEAPDSGSSRAASEEGAADDEITSPNMTGPGAVRGTSRSSRRPPVEKTSAAPSIALTSVVPTLKPGRPTSLPPPLRPSPGRISVATPAAPETSLLPVPTAAQAHAGMLDPWADHEAPGGAGGAAPSRSARLREEHPSGKDADDVVTSAPIVERASRLPSREEHERLRPPPSAALGPTPSSPPSPKGAESGVPGIPSDWPDVARRSLALHAVQRELARDEEVSGFALVAVLSGSVDVAATIVDAPAERLEAGALLRARGTIEAAAPLRVIAASPVARVATWNEKNLIHAFATCPTIEGSLRASGNRIQALVGATMGPLGERLDAALRTEVTGRLRLRVVAEGEIVARASEPVPGLVIVGVGELEMVGRAGVSEGAVLRSGDFLFPSEVLSAASAPYSMRGAKGGALLLVADRIVAQELLVTCPPLLEILAEA